MTEQTFRSSFNGFNREDVVRYLEYINAKHAAELNQLRSELEFLRSKEVPAPAEEVCDNSELVEQQAARIRELFDRCKEQEETIADLTARLENVQTAEAAPVACPEQELEAYRRAERAERVARERAEVVYHQANAVLSDATAKVDEAAALIGSMADQLSGQLSAFQSAVTGSKQALCDAAATLYAIRPEAEDQ